MVVPGESRKGYGESKNVPLLHSSKSRAPLISNLQGGICSALAPLNRSWVGTHRGWHDPNRRSPEAAESCLLGLRSSEREGLGQGASCQEDEPWSRNCQQAKLVAQRCRRGEEEGAWDRETGNRWQTCCGPG